MKKRKFKHPVKRYFNQLAKDILFPKSIFRKTPYKYKGRYGQVKQRYKNGVVMNPTFRL